MAKDPNYTGPCGLCTKINGFAYACSLPRFHPGGHQAHGLPIAEWPRVDGDEDWQTGQNHQRPLGQTIEIP